MRALKRLIQLSVTLIMLSACAAAPISIPEKYKLDAQLESVTQIDNFSLSNWKYIDTQSCIVQTSSSVYYLIILSRRSSELPYAENISISKIGTMVRPGNSSVTVRGESSNESFIINRIYRLKDYEEFLAIRAQLTAKPK